MTVAAAPLWGCGDSTAGPQNRFELVAISGDQQRGFSGEPLADPIVVRAVDGAGRPLPGTAVTAELVDGGALLPSSGVTGADGSFSATWRLGLAATQTLRVRVEGGQPITFHATATDPAAGDVIVLDGAEGQGGRIAAYDHDGIRDVEGYRVPAAANAFRFLPFVEPAQRDELVAFADGRRPALARVDWRPIRDTVRFHLRDPVQLPLAIWIAVPPFEANALKARSDIRDANVLWRRLGIEFVLGPNDVFDVTHDPDAEPFRGTVAPCSGSAPDRVGMVAGRINIYYVGDMPANSGYSCQGWVMIAQPRARGALLAHELGHELALPHAAAGNVMAVPPGPELLDGQAFHAHFAEGSALNWLYRAGDAGSRRDCLGWIVVAGKAYPRCPDYSLRLDDLIPSIWTATSPGNP